MSSRPFIEIVEEKKDEDGQVKEAVLRVKQWDSDIKIIIKRELINGKPRAWVEIESWRLLFVLYESLIKSRPKMIQAVNGANKLGRPPRGIYDKAYEAVRIYLSGGNSKRRRPSRDHFVQETRRIFGKWSQNLHKRRRGKK